MAEQKKVEAHAWLFVGDFDCEHEEITAILGIQPTKTWKRGDRVLPIAQNVHHENGWILDSPLEVVNSTLEDQVIALLAIAVPRRDAFLRLPSDATVHVGCAVYGYAHRPIVSLSRDAICGIASLGASLGIDVYDLSTTED
jgi:hypothetical protein